MNFRSFNGSLASFNAKFAGLLSRLLLIGVQIQVPDQLNQYLRSLESSFPAWAERTRSNIRMIQASRSTHLLTLQYLMADVLEEQRNPTSTTAKQTEERALRAKEHSGKKGRWIWPRLKTEQRH